MADYSELVAKQRVYFRSGKTRQLSWRKEQLQQVINMLETEAERMCEALHKDLRKPKLESMMMEVNMTRNDAQLHINSLADWSGPQKAKGDLLTASDTMYIQPEPYGVTLIMTAWNYPIQLALLPLVGAISAGNTCVLKPSEVAPATATLLEELVPKYLDRQAFAVVNGAIPETTALLKERWDLIFYTGNNVVAKIIYEAAAKYLTPVVLELGGKSPVYVDPSSDIDLVSRRLIWGKWTNCGQTCIAPDYVMCTKEIQEKLIERIRENLKSFYGDNIQDSPYMGRVINGRHMQRVKNLMSSGRVAIGGKIDEQDKYIEPTVLADCKPDDPAMTEEIFGPVLPFMTVKNVDEAIDFVNSREKPLAMYLFGKNKAVNEKFIANTSSGGVTVNDTMMHAAVATLPFGGVGHSGVGAYHGKFSFDCFSHKRACMIRPQSMEVVNNLRYPPYTDRKLNLLSWVMKKPAKRSGIASFLPVVVAGLAIAFVMKMLGFEKYIPQVLQK
jgi:aldehyde dehydrogenase (NAD+)